MRSILIFKFNSDQPIMSIKELDISPGSVFQIAVTPTLMNTTPAAIERFAPADRGCYVEGELPLKVLSHFGINLVNISSIELKILFNSI